MSSVGIKSEADKLIVGVKKSFYSKISEDGWALWINDLLKTRSDRPDLAFTAAQLFNIFWTLLWACLLFGGILFSVPDIK